MTPAPGIHQRRLLLAKSIITLSDATKLGIVGEVWVDLGTRDVVALACQGRGLFPTSRLLPLSHIQVIGADAVLIPNGEFSSEVASEHLSRLVGHEVVTESGRSLGKIDDYSFDSTGGLDSFLISSDRLAGLIEGNYRMSATETMTLGKERMIVRTGAEERLEKVDKGLNDWVAIGRKKASELASQATHLSTKPPAPSVPELPTDGEESPR